MHPATRKNYVWASNLFLASTALYLLPALYIVLKQLMALIEEKDFGYVFYGAMILICAFFLATFIWVSFGIRAGKTWAKALFCIYLAWVFFAFAKELPFFFQLSLWRMARRLVALSFLFSAAFFLFKNPLRKPEAPNAGVAGGGYNRPD